MVYIFDLIRFVSRLQKLKGLVRQKTTNSMPNPMAMGRAIFQKANNLTHKTSQNGRSESTIADVFGSKDAGLIPNKHRTFLMDTQVKYTVVSLSLDWMNGWIPSFLARVEQENKGRMKSISSRCQAGKRQRWLTAQSWMISMFNS